MGQPAASILSAAAAPQEGSLSRPLSSSILTAPNHLHPHIAYTDRTASGHFYEVVYALHGSVHLALLMLSAYGRNGPAPPTLQAVLQLHAHTLVEVQTNRLVGLHADMLVGLHANYACWAAAAQCVKQTVVCVKICQHQQHNNAAVKHQTCHQTTRSAKHQISVTLLSCIGSSYV